VGYRANIQSLGATYKLKLPHLTEGGADQAAAAERQKGKKHSTQSLGKTTTDLRLKYQHQDWMLEE
jgi:hypothetical protein